MLNTTSIHDLIIIGSGPAGYTAAIYAARSGLNTIVLEGYEYGGSLMNTTNVENFPGFPGGIMGPDLMEQMRKQAWRFGAGLRMEEAVEVSLDNDIKTIITESGTYQARAVILATGSAPRSLGVKGEKELSGRGVSSCATCDGFFFKDQVIAVVGGGDSAMEEAIFLTRFGREVVIIHRNQNFRASEIMLKRAQDNEKIRFLTDTVVEEILGEDNKVSGLQLKNVVTGDMTTLDVGAVFIAIGHDPRNSLLTDSDVHTDTNGNVVTHNNSTTTDVPGVFACGDLVDGHYRQAITAAGSGCKAALDAQEYLETFDERQERYHGL